MKIISSFIHISAVSRFFLLLGLVMVLVSVFTVDSRATENGDTLRLDYSEDGKLTLDAHDVKLSDLMAKICAKTKISSDIDATHLDNPISVSFQSLSLKAALKRVLNGINNICLFDPHGRIEKVITYPDGGAKKSLALEAPASPGGTGSEFAALARGDEAPPFDRIEENKTAPDGSAGQQQVVSSPDSIDGDESEEASAAKEDKEQSQPEKPQKYIKPPPEVVQADILATSSGVPGSSIPPGSPSPFTKP